MGNQTPFGHGWDSDHRGLFIDVRDEILFQDDDIKLVYKDFRRLKSSIPKRTKKYLDSVNKNWKYHNIDKKIENLTTLDYTINPNQFILELNKLDTQINEILIGAEKNAQKLALIIWTNGALRSWWHLKLDDDVKHF